MASELDFSKRTVRCWRSGACRLFSGNVLRANALSYGVSCFLNDCANWDEVLVCETRCSTGVSCANFSVVFLCTCSMAQCSHHAVWRVVV